MRERFFSEPTDAQDLTDSEVEIAQAATRELDPREIEEILALNTAEAKVEASQQPTQELSPQDLEQIKQVAQEAGFIVSQEVRIN